MNALNSAKVFDAATASLILARVNTCVGVAGPGAPAACCATLSTPESV